MNKEDNISARDTVRRLKDAFAAMRAQIEAEYKAAGCRIIDDLAIQNLPSNTNATKAAPVNAQPRDCLMLSPKGQGDMESDTGHEDETDMSAEGNTAVLQASADLGLNRTEPEEETVAEKDTTALEEAVEHKMAASHSQVVPDLDPNENA